MLDLKEFTQLVGDFSEPITASNLVATVVRLMKVANKSKELSGSMKKKLVIAYVKKVTDATENKWDDLLPDLIDGLLDAEKGKLTIKDKPWLKWCPCFNLKKRDLPYRS